MQSNGLANRLANWKGSCHDALFHSRKSLPSNPALLSSRIDCPCGSRKIHAGLVRGRAKPRRDRLSESDPQSRRRFGSPRTWTSSASITLPPQVVLVRNNQMLAAGLAAGDMTSATPVEPRSLGAAAAGVELKIVAGFVSRGRGYLVVRPDIKKARGLGRQTYRRAKHRRNAVDVRHADSRTTWFGCDAGPHSPARDRRSNDYRPRAGVAGRRCRGLDHAHLHSGSQAKGVFGADGSYVGDGRDRDRHAKKLSGEKSRGPREYHEGTDRGGNIS